MKIQASLFALCLLTGCGTSSDKSVADRKAAATPAAAPVKDSTSLLPAINRTSARVVPDHILGKQALPGGTLGDYTLEGARYQLFIVDSATAQDAAIQLLDLKVSLKDPAYIAYMGGYFGTDGGQPVYVFAKSHYLAGVVGLAEDQADPIARQLAARLH